MAVTAALVAGATLAGCSSDSGGPPVLFWYINPDGGGSDPEGGGQAQLAQECSTDEYSIDVQLLPNSASDQRIQLLRRLAAGDTTMDLMSVDPVFVAEFAEAEYLAPVPEDMTDEFTKDRVESALEAAKWKDKLVAVPFWANTQLLWYRTSVADEAGLDMDKPVTWKQLVDAAEKTDTTIGVQSMLYEGYTVWINALVAGAGGKILENPGADFNSIEFGLESPAGEDAAEVISEVASSGVGGPSMGSSDETASLNLFQSDAGGFMVNWPYVYAALEAAEVDWLDDLEAVQYPRTVEGEDSAPPFGGINLAVGADSANPDLAYEAAACITSVEHQTAYMVGTGNPASSRSVFDDPEVEKAFPNGIAALIRDSLEKAVPRPQSQYYGDISTGLQMSFSPPSAVGPQTPANAQTFILDVLKGKALL